MSTEARSALEALFEPYCWEGSIGGNDFAVVPLDDVLMTLFDPSNRDVVLAAMDAQRAGFILISTQGIQWGGPDGTGHRTERPVYTFPTPSSPRETP